MYISLLIIKSLSFDTSPLFIKSYTVFNVIIIIIKIHFFISVFIIWGYYTIYFKYIYIWDFNPRDFLAFAEETKYLFFISLLLLLSPFDKYLLLLLLFFSYAPQHTL